ncbi:mandelate racemase/muconate lactonizing enzyme family protein [Sedimentitalea sp. XS_ASV28]|uniref:mandelate racemase/muconate lactonizing enzyme family protein n=1 Tax=Sedimentitalea sp. XS_ASV28 TaxID=3241296 RepID=UPI003511DEA0
MTDLLSPEHENRLATAPRGALQLAEITAFAVSVPLPDHAQVTLGVGRTIKRDAVVVRVRSADGLTGWGEAHHGRAPTAIAAMINDTLAEGLVSMDGGDVVALNRHMARALQLTQGSSGAAALAISGIDMALWDLRARAAGWPLCRLLGGAPKPIAAYAGGVALGWDDPEALAEEARGLVARGYRAIKQRIGDSPQRDLARLRALRDALGPEVAIMCDANSLYSPRDVRQVMTHLSDLGIRWLEEPFMPQESRRYADAARYATVPLAAGENLFSRQEFAQLIAAGSVTEIQPDLSKAGGITEGLRIAGMALAHGLDVHPHASMTALNAAATLHFLSAIEGGGWLEADVSRFNPLRDALVSGAPEIGADGCFRAGDAPGLGVEVDEDFIREHPSIPGSAYRRD